MAVPITPKLMVPGPIAVPMMSEAKPMVKEVIIATMDKDLKSRTPNRKLIIRAMKRLELV